MREITKDFVEQVLDDMRLLEVCGKAMLADDATEWTRYSVARILETVAARMGKTVDVLDALVAGQTVAIAKPTETSETLTEMGEFTEIADAVLIGAEVLRLWEKFAARRRAVDIGNNGENS
jgi:hypothetical protein